MTETATGRTTRTGDERRRSASGTSQGRARVWYQHARVRNGSGLSHVVLTDAEDPFPPELQPHVTHDAVARLGSAARSELLRRSLVRYLHATSVLEVRFVSEVATEIAHGPADWDVPAEVRVEALQLCCDEAYHAVLASDLLCRLGCDESREAAPAFCSRLDRLRRARNLAAEDVRILRFLFVVVTETAFSSNLRGLARSPGSPGWLREFALDHARDEARHGAYFSSLFASFWSRLATGDRNRWQPVLPDLIAAFFAPALSAITADLLAVGLSPSDATQVVVDSYGVGRVPTREQTGIEPVLACFRRAGVVLDAYAGRSA